MKSVTDINRMQFLHNKFHQNIVVAEFVDAEEL